MVFLVREKKRKKERKPSFSILSTKFSRSEFVELRMKVHLLDKGYVWVPKKMGFCRGFKQGVREIKGFRFRKCP